MSFFAIPTTAPKPKTTKIRSVSLVFASFLVVLVVSQLFTYEEFPAALTTLGISEPAAHFLASIIVVSEVLALPFLLFIKTSPLMRAVSMVSGWVAVLALFILTVWENVGISLSGNSMLFGATLSVPRGWWSVCVAIALGVLAAWTAWGMWPKFSKK